MLQPCRHAINSARSTTTKMAGIPEIRQKNLALKPRCH
ncbi:hypothetical protein SS05631_c07910 [Sinorhizobium sp. CCBAU 05631]|nr:hypothetical protein SS05631_c07910 [Sinorhizobium sp. CCBAU 05631]